MAERDAKVRKRAHDESAGSSLEVAAEAAAAASEIPYETLQHEFRHLERSQKSLELQLGDALAEVETSSKANVGLLQRSREQAAANARLAEQADECKEKEADARRALAIERDLGKTAQDHSAGALQRVEDALQEARAELDRSRKDGRRIEVLEAQLLTAQCESRERQRLAENAEMVQSLQSALHAHSAEVAAARRLKEKADNAEIDRENLIILTSKLKRAEKAAEEAASTSAQLNATAAELERWRKEAATLCGGDGQAVGPDELAVVIKNLQTQLQDFRRDKTDAEQKLAKQSSELEEARQAQNEAQTQHEASSERFSQIESRAGSWALERESLKSERDCLQEVVRELSTSAGTEAADESLRAKLEEQLKNNDCRIKLLEESNLAVERERDAAADRVVQHQQLHYTLESTRAEVEQERNDKKSRLVELERFSLQVSIASELSLEFPDKCSQVHAPQLDECRSSLQETRQTVKNERLRSEQERRSADAVRAKLSELTKQNTRLLQELREVRERQ